MALVPDTNNFKLSDVTDVIDDTPNTGLFSTVTDSGGFARFASSDTGYLAVGKRVLVVGGPYNGSFNVTAISTNSWFETTESYKGSNSGTWTFVYRALSDCFLGAESDKFDPRYSGTKNKLYNFRNYGYEVILDYKDSDDPGGSCLAVHGDTSYVYTISQGNYGSDGIRSYTVNSLTGTFSSVIDQAHYGGYESYSDLWKSSTSETVWVAASNYGLLSYPVSAGSFSTPTRTDDGGQYWYITGDDDYVYVIREVSFVGYTLSVYDGGVLQPDGDYVWDTGVAYKPYAYDGYVYVPTSTGLYKFHYDSALTLDASYETYGFHGVYADDEFVFGVRSSNNYVYCFNHSLSPLDFIATPGTAGLYEIWRDGYVIFVAQGTDGLLAYRVDESGNLFFADSDDQGDSYQDVWGDGSNIYIANYDHGVRSYQYD